MSSGSDPTWIADSGIGWRILLVAELVDPPVDLERHLTGLFARQGWSPSDRALTVRAGTVAGLIAELCADSPAPLLIGCSGQTLVLSASHRACDGLGLLAALAALTASPVSSAARGIGDRAHRGGWTGVVRRVLEAAVAPPAPVALGRPTAPGDGDAFAETTIERAVGTAAVVSAGAAAVAALAGGSVRRVAVAVGVARRDDESVIADRSELVRLRGVDATTPVADLLRTALLEPAVGRGGGPGGGRLTRAAITWLRPRLGSTLLVSHLGAVSAPGVRHLAFYPVTAGGSGISVGAVTLHERTTVTARGRAADVDGDALAWLLASITTAFPAH